MVDLYGKRPFWEWMVIYLIIGGIIYGLIYYFVSAKKGGYVTPAVTEITIPLAMENNSGESGIAVLKEENGQTTVAIDLKGFQADVVQPTHIHIGACPGVGKILYPLTNVVNGKSTTVLKVTLDHLKNQLPLALNIHKSKTEITNYTACGTLKP